MKIAVSSGHGAGKSALISMVIHWALSTCVDTKIVVTANTESQLRTKTWPELLTWFRRAINAHWFDTTATSVASADPAHERTWRADAIPWSVTNTEGFAGLHNKGKRIVVIYDEASAIDDTVWEVTEGALTDEDTEIIWIAFGNPTRNTGRFRECFGKYKHRWLTKNLDSRTVEGTNKTQLNQWVEDYGEDSDFVRVRVRGEFPRAGSMQFIPSDIVDVARTREAIATTEDCLVLGVDVARFGDDESVICARRGMDARSIPWKKVRNASTMTLAAIVAELHDQYQFDAIFVDGGGVGGGVVDRLMQLRLPVIEVQFGSSADRGQQKFEGTVVYANKSAEMWGNMRDALRRLAIPDDADLAAQLTGREYSYTMREGKDAIQLEKKADMKKRGLSSPDQADALCFEGSTLIATPYGDKPIKDIKIGDEVLTPLGVSKVVITWQSLTDEITQADFSNGKSLRGKPEHNIFTWHTGQTRMDALSLTDVILVKGQLQWLPKFLALFGTLGKNIQFKPLVDIIRAGSSVTARAFCIAIFGMIITELSHRIMTFITKTTNGGIMTLKIWNVSLQQSMADCPHWKTIEAVGCNPQLPVLRLKPQNGTPRPKDLLGIAPMANNHGATGQPKQKNVQSVKNRLKHFLSTALVQDSVLTLASKRRI